jgi:hypothetical protein
MKDLYLKTEHGREQIDKKTAEKYPDEDSEASIRQDFLDMPMQGIPGDGLDEMDNGFVMSQSEIIDFSQGVDSRMDENR